MSIWPQLLHEIENFPRDVRNLPVSPQVSREEIRTELDQRYTFDTPVPLDTLTEDVMRMMRAWTVHVTHPRYFGLFNPSVRQAGVIADALAALYNPQLATWSHAPVANELEQLTLLKPERPSSSSSVQARSRSMWYRLLSLISWM